MPHYFALHQLPACEFQLQTYVFKHCHGLVPQQGQGAGNSTGAATNLNLTANLLPAVVLREQSHATAVMEDLVLYRMMLQSLEKNA